MKYRDYKVGFTVEVPDYLSEVKEASYEVFNVADNTLKYFILLDDDGEVVRTLSIAKDDRVVKTEEEYLEVVESSVAEMEDIGFKRVFNNTMITPSGRVVERYFLCDVELEENIALLAYFTRVKDSVVVSTTYVTEFFDEFENELFDIFDSIQEL